MGEPRGGPDDARDPDREPVRLVRPEPPDLPLTGVCYVRVQVAESGVLSYRVTVNPDISRRPERRWECRDSAEAVRVVREFLLAFEASAGVTDR